MRKVVAWMLVLVLAMGTLTACGSTDEGSTDKDTTTKEEGTYEIALVTDVESIDDKSFNQGAWEGVVEYGEKNDISYNYFRPSEDSTETRIEAIKTAIDKGAKVVVCPGILFEEAIYTIQKDYPDTMFLLLDGEPHDADCNYEIAPNVHCILYQEEQAGYFAGYAAVKEGYKELAFLGGIDVPVVIRYGYGYIQGADAAAKEMNVKVNMKYWYSGSFAPTDDIVNKVSGWYTDGTEVVFACGGNSYLSATQAAEAAEGKVIGVDVDQSAESDAIITSATKELTTSVVMALGQLYDNDGTWSTDLGGKTSILGVADDGVGLPTAEGSWRMKKFTVDDYAALFESVKSGKVTISNNTQAAPTTTNVTVDYQN
ncbi:MAG: BMP family ABC transporter substrate-binding protein [Lachnospiraceae bacterium]